MVKRSKSREWLQAVADKAKSTPKEVQAFLDAKDILPAPVLGSPRRLILTRIAFSGVKTGDVATGEFEFTWNSLSPGLWGIVTDGNLKGKSSVIEVVRWMLRGRFPDRLSDVRSWIHDCSVQFRLDEAIYEVRAHTVEGVRGTLVKNPGNQEDETELASFDGDAEFESTMSAFFMRELDLDAIWRWRTTGDEDAGRGVVHGWPGLSGVMFVGTEYSVLLGDIPVDAGVATPLMQMYLGLPWVSTLSAAKVVERSMKRDLDASERKRKANAAARRARRDEIQKDLDAARARLEGTPSDDEVRREITGTRSDAAALRKRERELVFRSSRYEQALLEAQSAYDEDRRNLQAHIDAEAAGEVFRRLDPTICPRCETPITEQRRQRERYGHQCCVCGDPISSNTDSAVARQRLDEELRASRTARDAAKRSRDDCDRLLQETRDQSAGMDSKEEALLAKLAELEPRRKIETEIAVLEARLAESSFDPEGESSRADSQADFAIAKAIVAETDERVKAVQDDVLEDVSKRITSYARRFGIANLESAELKGNGHLPLRKGGVDTSYSKCTEGEKLRLKVATVLAVIGAGEARGVGRHPGLLLIDSPAAQEVAQKDLDELISGLSEISGELAHLQVFVASLASPAVTKHISDQRMVVARGDDALW